MPTLGAFAFRHQQGKPYVYPDNELSYTANFLAMLFKMSEPNYAADERLVKALEVLFILHADHEQNCSTNAVRSVGLVPGRPVLGGGRGRRRPLRPAARRRQRGRAADAEADQDHRQHPRLHRRCEERQREADGLRPPGLQELRPRAKIIKKACDDVFEVTGTNPLLNIAQELEKIALEDEYFVKRKLYPNVDFYSGLIYEALQFPPEMFTVLFAIGRTPGWLAQWSELVQDKEQKIARPKQVYTGIRTREFVPIDQR